MSNNHKTEVRPKTRQKDQTKAHRLKSKFADLDRPTSRSEFGLQEIKKRYYHEHVNSTNLVCDVFHRHNCAIFRSLEQYKFCFCSCGLLHDLEKNLTDTGLIEVIYPRYWHDYWLQERGEDSDEETPDIKAAKKKEKEECKRILLEVFGPPSYTTLADIKKKYEEDKKLLRKVFGKKFNNAFFRLDQRLVNEIDEHRRYSNHRSGRSS